MHSNLKKGLFLVTFLGMTVSPGISVMAKRWGHRRSRKNAGRRDRSGVEGFLFSEQGD